MKCSSNRFILLLLVLVSSCSTPTVVMEPTIQAPRKATIEPTALPPTIEPTAPPPTIEPTALPPTIEPTALPPTIEPTALPPTIEPTALPPTIEPTPIGTELSYVYPVRSADCSASSSHHDYPASDIFCPIGTEYVAVTDGIIDFVSREDRYAAGERDPSIRGGLSVAFIGDDGVRYYGSHLSAVVDGIDVGVRVSVGQVLGLTGVSGNAVGTPPHVHFGISPPTTPEDWVIRRGTIWPQPYLRAWAAGEALTPDLAAP